MLFKYNNTQNKTVPEKLSEYIISKTCMINIIYQIRINILNANGHIKIDVPHRKAVCTFSIMLHIVPQELGRTD